MRRAPGLLHGLLCVAVLSLAAGSATAARHIGFETDALNRVIPVSYAKTAVFSPASFEVDCALFAESLDTIPKAGVSETMGVVIDFESAYRPILEGLAGGTNGFVFAAARGFCVPDIQTAQPAHRQFLERTYGAEVMRLHPKAGAEAWFRAETDGTLEDFAISPEVSLAQAYSFYDLASVHILWRDPFPVANTAKGDFIDAAGVAHPAEFMSDTRVVDTWVTKEYTLLKLPLGGDAWFYAILPKPGFTLANIREDMGSARIDALLAVTKSLVEKGVGHGPCRVILPKLDLVSRFDIRGAQAYFRVPTTGLTRVAGAVGVRECVQYARFRMDERGAPKVPQPREEEAPALLTGAALPGPKELVFNRPFVFFVHHEGSATIPVAGQYCGDAGAPAN